MNKRQHKKLGRKQMHALWEREQNNIMNGLYNGIIDSIVKDIVTDEIITKHGNMTIGEIYERSRYELIVYLSNHPEDANNLFDRIFKNWSASKKWRAA